MLLDTPWTWGPFWGDDKFGRQHSNGLRQWNDMGYQTVRQAVELAPPGALRDQALDRIRGLDCSEPDPTLAPCDRSLPQPPIATAWQAALKKISVDKVAYAKALAAELKTLVCSGGDQTNYVLRGLIANERLRAVHSQAPALVYFIMSEDNKGPLDFITGKDSQKCPVSASLTDSDKAKLLRIKQDAIKPGG